MRQFPYGLATLAALLMLMLPALASAQGSDTVEVEIGPKTQVHPFYGVGSNFSYVIDGVEARELTFVRFRTYVFHINHRDSTWRFYLSGSHIGGGRDHEYRGLPTRAWALTGEYFPYRPIATSRDLLYYQCSFHEYVGWKIHIVDSLPSGVDADGNRGTLSLRARAWIAGDGDRLMIHYDLDRAAALRLELFDCVGRAIASNDLGERDAGERITNVELGHLPSGFYLYRLTELNDGTAVTGTLRIAH